MIFHFAKFIYESTKLIFYSAKFTFYLAKLTFKFAKLIFHFENSFFIPTAKFIFRVKFPERLPSRPPLSNLDTPPKSILWMFQFILSPIFFLFVKIFLWTCKIFRCFFFALFFIIEVRALIFGPRR